MSLRRLFAVAFVLPFTLTATLLAQQAAPAQQQTNATPPPPAAQQQAPAPQGPNQTPASTPTPANTITRNVQLVVLDAVVLDGKGNPVTDLKQSEFHVIEDKESQTIRNFEMPGQFQPPADAAIESTADLDRIAPRAPVNIILLDEFNTRFEDMAFARYCLKKWLDKQPGRLSSPTMLIAVDLQHFTVLRDYTQNKDEILQALEHHFVAYPWQAHQFAWVAERYSTALISLRRVSEAVLGHRGHKTMIWLGRGFPTLNRSRITADQNELVNTAVQQTINQLRDARVTLYTIDPAGVMVDPGVYGPDARDFAPFGGDPDFQELAKATGGRNLYGRNDVDAEIGSSIRDGSSFYTLTYRPATMETDTRKFRRIVISVDRPGLTIVSRQGYYPNIRAARLNKDNQAGRNLSLELGAASNSNMVYDSVPFTVKPVPNTPGKIELNVDSHGLSWYLANAEHPRHTRLIMLITYFDKKGKELKQAGSVLDFPAPPGSSATGRIEHNINFMYSVAPDPKAVRTRIVVRVESSGHMGTVDVPIENGVVQAGANAVPVAAPAAAPTTSMP